MGKKKKVNTDTDKKKNVGLVHTYFSGMRQNKSEAERQKKKTKERFGEHNVKKSQNKQGTQNRTNTDRY